MRALRALRAFVPAVVGFGIAAGCQPQPTAQPPKDSASAGESPAPSASTDAANVEPDLASTTFADVVMGSGEFFARVDDACYHFRLVPDGEPEEGRGIALSDHAPDIQLSLRYEGLGSEVLLSEPRVQQGSVSLRPSCGEALQTPLYLDRASCEARAPHPLTGVGCADALAASAVENELSLVSAEVEKIQAYERAIDEGAVSDPKAALHSLIAQRPDVWVAAVPDGGGRPACASLVVERLTATKGRFARYLPDGSKITHEWTLREAAIDVRSPQLGADGAPAASTCEQTLEPRRATEALIDFGVERWFLTEEACREALDVGRAPLAFRC